jgi:flagellar biosynthesis protein FlhA
LFIVLYTKKSTVFSPLPTILLISTVFSLAVSISTVRTILTKGVDYEGWVIRFVSNLIGGTGETVQLWIGFAIFLFFAAFIVFIIIKGATRIVEVAARFTLDSMEIKMMKIKEEFSCGSITEEQAQLQKQEILKESDYFGSLDGAMRFVSGNTKVILFLILLTLIGGSSIEHFIRDSALFEAIKIYVHYSIGCGIVFLLPVFLVSLSVGIVVTRLLSQNEE